LLAVFLPRAHTFLSKSREPKDFSTGAGNSSSSKAIRTKVTAASATVKPEPASTEDDSSAAGTTTHTGAAAQQQLVLETVEDPLAYFDHTWPFQNFCDLLAHELFE
jgi:hypothetical protein